MFIFEFFPTAFMWRAGFSKVPSQHFSHIEVLTSGSFKFLHLLLFCFLNESGVNLITVLWPSLDPVMAVSQMD